MWINPLLGVVVGVPGTLAIWAAVGWVAGFRGWHLITWMWRD